MAQPTTEASTDRRRWTTGRAVAAMLVVGMVAMWAYVLYLAIGPGRQPPPDRLDDPAFAAAAEVRCDEALDVVAALPRASEATTATHRAAVVAEANRAFAEMLVDLDRIAPGGEDGEIVREWLTDWRTYFHHREGFGTPLGDDPNARLFGPRRKRPITGDLEAFGRKPIAAGAPPLKFDQNSSRGGRGPPPSPGVRGQR